MSDLNVTRIKGRTAGSAPNFPDGIAVTDTTQSTSTTTGAVVISGGVGIAKSLHVGGNVSVGGTLTYEDVTNVDSVGLITAKSGIKVGNPSSTGIGATIHPNGNAVFAGIVTASQFSGIDTDKISEGNTEVEAVDTGSDGHVKMTTEGSERVRVGPAGQIGLGGANYGSSGQLLTSAGSGAAPSWTTVNTAPQIEATASGAITAGDSVIINSNGTVTRAKETYSEVSPIAGFSSGDTNIPNGSDETSEWRTCLIKDNYMLAAYKRGNGSNTVRVRQIYIADGGAATVSSNEGNISDSNSFIVEVAHDPVRNQAVILYRKSDTKLYIRTIRSTATTSLNWGNEVAISSTAGWEPEGNVCISYDTAASKFLLVYAKDPETSDYATAQTMTVVDDNTFTFGTRVTFKSNTTTDADVAYDSTAGKHLIVYRDSSISNDSYGIVATVSGTDVSFGTAVELETGDNLHSKLAYSTTDNKFIWFYLDTTAGGLDVSALTISGTSVSRGAVSTITVTSAGANNEDTIATAYDPTLDKFYLLYLNNGVGKMSPATLSGTSVTLGTETNSRLGNGVSDQDLAYDASSNRFLFVLQNGHTNAGLYQVWQTSTAATNLTGENYVGVAAATVADAATATIDVSGATNSNQSSLSAGQKYYVQNNGSLGLTAASPVVFAGTAIAANKIIVNDQAPVSEGMTRLGGGNFTGSSGTVDIFDGFTSDYMAYKVVFNFTNSAGEFGVRLGTSSAWKTSGYWHQSCFSDGGSADMGGGNNSWARFNSNPLMGAGELMIIDPTSTAQNKITYFQGFSSRSATPNNQTQFGGRGSVLDTTDVITKAQFISEGNITYLKWVLYGIK